MTNHDGHCSLHRRWIRSSTDAAYWFGSWKANIIYLTLFLHAWVNCMLIWAKREHGVCQGIQNLVQFMTFMSFSLPLATENSGSVYWSYCIATHCYASILQVTWNNKSRKPPGKSRCSLCFLNIYIWGYTKSNLNKQQTSFCSFVPQIGKFDLNRHFDSSVLMAIRIKLLEATK